MVITLFLRVAQLLFAAVVIALSAVLINGYGPGHNPSIIDYGAFCGGAGLIIAVVGIAAIFFDALQGIIVLALDAFAAFFLLAGGLAFAVTIKVGSCADQSDDGYLARHLGTFAPSLNKYDNDNNANQEATDLTNDTISRCRMIQADTAFIWFLSGCFLVTVVLSFLNKSSKRGGSLV